MREWRHDQWVRFLATVLGDIAYIPDVLVYYRQHGGNVFGLGISDTGTMVSFSVHPCLLWQKLRGHEARYNQIRNWIIDGMEKKVAAARARPENY